MSAFLAFDDVRRLAGGRKRFAAIRKALDSLGIPYRVAKDGEPLVRPESLDATPIKARNRGPRWERLNMSEHVHNWHNIALLKDPPEQTPWLCDCGARAYGRERPRE